MKTPNPNTTIVLDLNALDDEDLELRDLITVDLEDDDAPAYQAVDEFSDEFLLQAPRRGR
ncbi:MAG: hypothetical protein QFF03_10215 [Pseudomonadota bacterium]|nr:hypothetical protein [Pseudomonadota bacterium]